MSVYHGIAPEGVYRDVGWSGATQLFDIKHLGSFAYTEDNLQVSNGAVRIAKELVRYDINSKPLLISVRGNPNDGYLYSIEWFDSMHAHKLECANTEFSTKITRKAIALAKKIDEVNHPSVDKSRR